MHTQSSNSTLPEFAGTQVAVYCVGCQLKHQAAVTVAAASAQLRFCERSCTMSLWVDGLGEAWMAPACVMQCGHLDALL
jgi:hypothetical protein